MSAPPTDNQASGEAGSHGRPAPASRAAAPLATATTARPTAIARPLPSGAMPASGPVRLSALERMGLAGPQALAEITYHLRRLGTSTLLGCAAAVMAGVVFVTSTLPQGAAVTSLQSDLVRLRPVAGEGVKPTSTGSTLASLPSRAEAPAVVSKILEEARAAGVELPRGQYEYVPAREGMAARYRMTFPVRATYPQIRQFMDRTLVALPAVAIEGLRIERKNVGEDGVDAELKLSAYVRSDP